MKKSITFLLVLFMFAVINAQEKHNNTSKSPKQNLYYEDNELKNSDKMDDKNLTKRQITNSSKALWDILYSNDMSTLAGNQGFYAAFLWDGNLYGSRWSQSATDNAYGKIYKFIWSENSFISDGTFIISGLSTDYNFEGFTTDGTYIYAVNESNKIFKINPTTWTIVDNINITFSPVGIAYDVVNNGFWLLEYQGSTASFVSMTGVASGATLTSSVRASGITYDNTTPGGPYLWIADAYST